MATTKICMLTPYYPPIKGGVSSYVSNLVFQLTSRGFNVKVITYSSKKHTLLSKVFFLKDSLVNLYKFKPEIVHSHSNWYTLLPSAFYKLARRDIRLIFTFHTEISDLKGIKKLLFKMLISICDDVTFVSYTMMVALTNSFSINVKKHVIYAGVSKKNVSEIEIQEFRNRYGFSDRCPIITFIGPLVWEKKVEGVKLLINSFRDVIEIYPKSALLIIGDGPYISDLKTISKKLNLSESVFFIGFVDNVFIPLSITDIYAHISLMDGCPISLLEAMSCKKPIIASNVGGIPEIIINDWNGYLVDSNAIEISNKIIELWKDMDTRGRFSLQCIKDIEEKYTWAKIANQFVCVYRGGI